MNSNACSTFFLEERPRWLKRVKITHSRGRPLLRSAENEPRPSAGLRSSFPPTRLKTAIDAHLACSRYFLSSSSPTRFRFDTLSLETAAADLLRLPTSDVHPRIFARLALRLALLCAVLIHSTSALPAPPLGGRAVTLDLLLRRRAPTCSCLERLTETGRIDRGVSGLVTDEHELARVLLCDSLVVTERVVGR